MRNRGGCLVIGLLMTFSSFAQEVFIPAAAEAADSTTLASQRPAFLALQQHSLAALRHALQGGAATLSREGMRKSMQSPQQADQAWVTASDYDFQKNILQQRGITLLSGFTELPQPLLKTNLQTVITINEAATATLRQQALVDAEGVNYLWFLSEALGPRLGNAFINAYARGELSKAAALIKASEISTGKAKQHFNYARPFLVQGSGIYLVPDDVLVKDNHVYSADGGSFPSGHTNTGYTDALLLAQMLPERYPELVIRAARYGYSRVVLGVHYPLDVMGARMVAQYNVAHYLNDKRYRVLFELARDQFRRALEKECGIPLAECAKSESQDDPYRDPAMVNFYRFTMTYALPRETHGKMQLTVPDGAEVLLESALPQLSAAGRREVMARAAVSDGYPLSGSTPEQQFWLRLDLVAAWALAQKGG